MPTTIETILVSNAFDMIHASRFDKLLLDRWNLRVVEV